MPPAVTADMLQAVLGPISLPPQRLASIAAAVQEFSPKAIRLNPLAGAAPHEVGFPVEPVPWLAGRGYWPVGDVQPGRRIPFGAGLYYVQDAGSMLAIRLLDARPGETICDLCAAPGGKATAILEDLGPAGGLLANEAVRGRTDALRLNLARHGASRFVAASLDPDRLAGMLPDAFDAVLADAPCTGQSLVAAGKQKVSCFDGKWIDHGAARQRRILAAAAQLVRPGGRLVYSTCTFSWAENEGQILQLLADRPDFELAAIEALAAWRSPPPAPAGCYRLWPDRDRAAGAFAALLRRREDALRAPMPGQPPQTRPRRRREPRAAAPPQPPWTDWGTWTGDVRIVAAGPSLVAALPADLPAPLNGLLDDRLAVALPAAARLIGRTWQPAHALAMRRDGAFQPHTAVDVSDAQAGEYLGGQPIETRHRGWAVATWQDHPLGWIHGTGRTAANKLDKAARLAVVA